MLLQSLTRTIVLTATGCSDVGASVHREFAEIKSVWHGLHVENRCKTSALCQDVHFHSFLALPALVVALEPRMIQEWGQHGPRSKGETSKCELRKGLGASGLPSDGHVGTKLLVKAPESLSVQLWLL